MGIIWIKVNFDSGTVGQSGTDRPLGIMNQAKLDSHERLPPHLPLSCQPLLLNDVPLPYHWEAPLRQKGNEARQHVWNHRQRSRPCHFHPNSWVVWCPLLFERGKGRNAQITRNAFFMCSWQQQAHAESMATRMCRFIMAGHWEGQQHDSASGRGLGWFAEATTRNLERELFYVSAKLVEASCAWRSIKYSKRNPIFASPSSAKPR